MNRSSPLLTAVLLLFAAAPASAQNNFFWNYSGTNPNASGSWNPSGVPFGTDRAIFDTFDGTTFNLPVYTANDAYGEYRILGPAPFAITPFVGNGNTLTFGTGGNMVTAPLTYRGSFSTTLIFDNLRTNIANGTIIPFDSDAASFGAIELSGFAARFDLLPGSQLRAVNEAGTGNYDLTINGGAQVRVFDGATITNGVGLNNNPQGAIRFHGGGALTVQASNSAAAVFDLNQVSSASGHATVGVFSGGLTTAQPAQLNLGNGTLQRGIDRYFRRISTGEVLALGSGTIEFNFNGVVPGFAGATGDLFMRPGPTVVPTQNGVITEASSANSNSPYVILTGIVRDTSGASVSGLGGRFATINPGTGEVTAQLGTTLDQTNLSNTNPGENIIYRPTNTTANAVLSNDISPQTIVFEPRGNGQSVDLNGQTLTTPGLMLSGRPITGTGPFTFSIDNGTIAGPDAALRNVFVLGGANNFLNIGATFGSGGGVVKSGGGTLVLTGNTPQMNFGGDVILNEGTIRARISGANANLGTNNRLLFRGGTLEVDAGGGTATFNRSLGTSLGQVNWTGLTFSDRGGGGFSVVNGDLNVNIGGSGQTLVWNGFQNGNEHFVRSGQPLRFGSFQSGGMITLVNDLALDGPGQTLAPEARQIIVDAPNFQFGNPAFRTRITGVILGSPASALRKTGPGILELTNANTYAGATLVDVGTLQVSNTVGSATGAGPVVVYDTLIGNGIIAPAPGNGVTTMPNSFLGLYRDQILGTPGNLTIGSAGNNNPVTLRAGTNTIFQLNGTNFDPNGGPTSYSRLTVRGTGDVDVANAGLIVAVNFGFTPDGGDVFGILDNQTGNAIIGRFAGVPDGGTVNVVFPDNSPAGTFQVSYFGDISGGGISITGGNDIVLHSFTPIPEPGAMLALCAASFGAVGIVRRVRRRVRA